MPMSCRMGDCLLSARTRKKQSMGSRPRHYINSTAGLIFGTLSSPWDSRFKAKQEKMDVPTTVAAEPKGEKKEKTVGRGGYQRYFSIKNVCAALSSSTSTYYCDRRYRSEGKRRIVLCLQLAYPKTKGDVSFCSLAFGINSCISF